MEKPKNPYTEESKIWKLMDGDFLDKTTEEIAEILDSTPTSVRSMIQAIKRKTGYTVERKRVEHLDKLAKYNDPSWIGETFSRLTVIEAISKRFPCGVQHYVWRVRCECGKELVVEPSAILDGRQVSCGCYKEEYIDSIRTGMSKKEYHRKYIKDLRYWRKIHHKCRVCGKEDAYTLNGRSTCFECTEKRRKTPIEYIEKEGKHDSYIKRMDRRKNGLCYICGKPVMEKKKDSWDVYNRKPGLCQHCYDVFIKNMREGIERKGRKPLEPYSMSEKALMAYQNIKKNREWQQGQI